MPKERQEMSRRWGKVLGVVFVLAGFGFATGYLHLITNNSQLEEPLPSLKCDRSISAQKGAIEGKDDIAEIRDRTLADIKKFVEMQPVDGRISKISIALDKIVLENVCWAQKSMTINVYTDNADDVAEIFAPKNYGSYRFFHKWKRLPTQEWRQHASEGAGLQMGENVLLLPNEQQPAHCLEDQLFTAFMVEPHGLKFDSYLAKRDSSSACDSKLNWCCSAFERAGIVNMTNNVAYQNPQTCYRWLTVLPIAHGRYAPEWDIIDLKEHQAKIPRLPGMYYRQNLINLHKSIVNYDGEITSSLLDIRKTRSTRTSVLVIDRKHSRRRRWLNAMEFIEAFVQAWPTMSPTSMSSLTYMGEDFARLTPIQQLRTFHNADLIISAHGAELSNLIAGVPGRTCVFELMCTEKFAETEFYEQNETMAKWFGTFPSRLRMRSFNFRSLNKVCSHSGKNFTVNVPKLIEAINMSNVLREEIITVDL